MTDPEPASVLIARLVESHPHLQRLSDLQAPEQPPAPRRETQEEAQERAEARVRHYQTRWDLLVPPMYAEASRAALDASQRFDWPEGSLNLVLAGDVGTGKTYAAYAVGNHLAAHGVWVHATTVGDFLVAHRPDGDHYARTAADRAAVLILDDLGAGKSSEFAQETLTALMDLRIRQGRRTIITTNATEAQLEESWGGRFLDRVRFRRTVHVFRGASRRVGAW